MSDLATIDRAIRDWRPQITESIPGGMTTFDRVLSAAILACRQDDKLRACEPKSIVSAVMDAASLGLHVHWGVRGEAVIVPFGSRATLVVGYRGLLKVWTASTPVYEAPCLSVHAAPVYAEDLYEHELRETGLHFRHRSSPEIERPAPTFDEPFPGVRFWYAFARLRNGESQVVEIPRSKMERIRADVLGKIRDQAKAAESAWGAWPLEMAQKTCLRRLSSVVPSGELVDRAREIEDQHEAMREIPGERVDTRNGKFTAPQIHRPSPGKTIAGVGVAGAEFVQDPGPEIPPPETPPDRSPDQPSEPPPYVVLPGEPKTPPPTPEAERLAVAALNEMFTRGPVVASAFGKLIRQIPEPQRPRWIEQYNAATKKGTP